MTKKSTPKKSATQAFSAVKGKKTAAKITASAKKKKPAAKKTKKADPTAAPSLYLGGGFRCGTMDIARRNWGRKF